MCGLSLVDGIRGYCLVVVCGLSTSMVSLVERRLYDTWAQELQALEHKYSSCGAQA